MTGGAPPIAGQTKPGRIEDFAGLSRLPFLPGRFANRMTRTGAGRHSANFVRETLSSTFVLTLTEAGEARLCRSWRYLSANAGPDVDVEENLHERFGYRGLWRPLGDDVEITLERDDGICPPLALYTRLVPRHERSWRLSCSAFAAPGHPWLPAEFLACRLHERPQFGEDQPHALTLPGGGGAILLGRDNGLVIEASYDPTAAAPEAPPRIYPSAEPIREDGADRP